MFFQQSPKILKIVSENFIHAFLLFLRLFLKISRWVPLFFEELVLYRSICNSDNHFYSSYHKLFKTELTARRCTESFFITICSNPALSR